MTYERVKHLKPEELKRLCGVQVETVNQTVAVMQQAKQQLKPGKPSKLSLEDQVLMTLEYLREYRTYFHIAQTWGVDESTARAHHSQCRRYFDALKEFPAAREEETFAARA